MLVIHPTDRTTDTLSALYTGVEGVRLYRGYLSGAEVGSLLHATSPSERIMLLGHGGPNGLFWRYDDTQPVFDNIIVAHRHGYALRRHGGNIVAVFCNAYDYAVRERLHGLFTGMIISEMSEAQMYGIESSQAELDEEIPRFVARLRGFLDEGVPLHHIPTLMRQADDRHSPLTQFNYNNVFYI